jgi:uncharacterized protein
MARLAQRRLHLAPVAELVDAPDSKSGDGNIVLVRVRPGAPVQSRARTRFGLTLVSERLEMPNLTDPLATQDLERVTEMLGCRKEAMNLEMLDGFFAALICGPDMVPPSEYLPEILGTAHGNWQNSQDLEEFFTLMLRHWNAITSAIDSDEPYLPVLFENAQGVAFGNDWATGFTRGMGMRRQHWTALIDDEAHAGLLIPIFALAHEHDPDPEMRPYQQPIDAQRREQLILGSAASVQAIRRYFMQRRRRTSSVGPDVRTRSGFDRRPGRNEPCPCGSGKKFKKCCGGIELTGR